jgi:GNAT superfamily N-acetyltransferase
VDDLVRREPVPEDADAIGRMHHQAWVDTYSGLLPPGWFDEHGPQEQVDRWRRILAEPLPEGARRTAVFDVAEPVAFAVCGPALTNVGVAPVREHALWALYVARAHLGTGLGRALLEWAVGDGPAELWVAEGNERAIAFYRRHGFAEDGSAVEDAVVPLVEVRMVR